MREVGVRELKEHAAELLRELESKREAIIITRRGRAVARLVPVVDSEALWGASELALADVDELAREIGKHLPPGASAVGAVREGRRAL